MTSSKPHTKPLEGLPTEQLCKIVSYLDHSSLSNLRLASKTLQQHTLLPFSDRFTKTTDTNFFPDKLETLVRMLESDTLASRVKTLRIWGTPTDGADIPPMSFWNEERPDLLEKLWSKLHTITHLAIGSKIALRTFSTEPQSEVLQAFMSLMGASPNQHLKQFDIRHARLDYKVLMEFLAAHADVFKTLNIRDCVLEGGNWTDVLQYIFDYMVLDRLHIEGLTFGVDGKRRVKMETVPLQRIKKEGAKGIEYYSLNSSFASMVGKNGVEAGLIKLFGFERKVGEMREPPTFVSVPDEKPVPLRRSTRLWNNKQPWYA